MQVAVYMAGKIGKNDWRHEIFKDHKFADNGLKWRKLKVFIIVVPIL
jgi:hypothetical protein